MRSLIIVSECNGQFTISASGRFGGGYSNLPVKTPEQAAIKAASEAVRYCTKEGCDILAPLDVRKLIPDFGERDIEFGMGF